MLSNHNLSFSSTKCYPITTCHLVFGSIHYNQITTIFHLAPQLWTQPQPVIQQHTTHSESSDESHNCAQTHFTTSFSIQNINVPWDTEKCGESTTNCPHKLMNMNTDLTIYDESYIIFFAQLFSKL